MSDPIHVEVEEEEVGWFAALLESEWGLLAIDYAMICLRVAVVFIVGVFASRFLARASARLVDRLGLEVLAERLGVARLLYKVGVREGVAKLSGRIVRWFGLLLTLYVAITQLRLEALTRAGAAVFAFLPTLLAAIVIAAGGVWLGDRIKSALLGDRGGTTEPVSSTRRALAHAASVTVTALAVMLSLEQLGIEITLIHDILLSIYAVFLCGAAVMLALGAQASTGELIAGYYGRKLLRVGDSVQRVDVPGSPHLVIRRLDPLHVIASREGSTTEVLLPYTAFLQERIRVRYEASSAKGESG